MSDYIVGDIQGCLSELKKLLKKVKFDKNHDTLWLTGDLVARGPDSLETLRFIKAMGNSAKVVLGNHDLHLIAVSQGIKKVKASDRVDAILNAPDRNELIDWLSQQPLIQQIPNSQAYISHAGLPPEWRIEQVLKRAAKAQKKLRSNKRNYWLEQMYGNFPTRWQDAKTKEDKFRYTINALTRMRYCLPDKSLDFDQKTLVTGKNPQSLTPWYELADIPDDNYCFFGHWAALMGKCPKPNVIALDTGCVWGNTMTMYCWQTSKRITVKACT